MKNEAKSVDISSRKLVSLRDAENARTGGATRLVIGENSVVTPSARDFLAQHNITVVAQGKAEGAATAAAYGAGATKPAASAQKVSPANPKLFSTPEAEAVKKEICAVGHKLWMRQFVDGNGGNISYRIGPNEVICTPTLMSKFDLTPEDLCLVDLDGVQVAGKRPRTSEIFMHLEIYKAQPAAKAVCHCHPPHATAYAITGRVPPNLIIPEFEVFVGKVAISPYETPGTAAFAQTVLPYVKDHNTILLSNHGIVCWADTVTHAEWYAEVLDTYCWTLMNATQLGVPISQISEQKGDDLLAIKKSLGLPDARFDTSHLKECQLSDVEPQSPIALLYNNCAPTSSTPSQVELEKLIKSVTDAVMGAIGSK